MALVAGQITSTETASTALTVISDMVQAYLTENAVLLPTVWDRTADIVPGAKEVDINRRTGLTAEDKAEGSDYTAQKFTWAADSLVLDQRQGVYVELTGDAQIESLLNQESSILDASIIGLVEALEAKIYTALAAASAATPDHRLAFETADVLSLNDIISARKLLNKAKAPKTDRFLAINSDQEADLLRLENFLHADKYGDRMPLINGEIGMLLGFRVLVTEYVTASTCLAYHRSHVAFGRQLAMTWEQGRNLKADVTEYLLQTKYGLKTLDSGVRGVLINNTGA